MCTISVSGGAVRPRPRVAQGRATTSADVKLFPLWDAAYVRDLVQRVAIRDSWPTSLRYDGSHCARHGGALQVFEDAIG